MAKLMSGMSMFSPLINAARAVLQRSVNSEQDVDLRLKTAWEYLKLLWGFREPFGPIAKFLVNVISVILVEMRLAVSFISSNTKISFVTSSIIAFINVSSISNFNTACLLFTMLTTFATKLMSKTTVNTAKGATTLLSDATISFD